MSTPGTQEQTKKKGFGKKLKDAILGKPYARGPEDATRPAGYTAKHPEAISTETAGTDTPFGTAATSAPFSTTAPAGSNAGLHEPVVTGYQTGPGQPAAAVASPHVNTGKTVGSEIAPVGTMGTMAQHTVTNSETTSYDSRTQTTLTAVNPPEVQREWTKAEQLVHAAEQETAQVSLVQSHMNKSATETQQVYERLRQHESEAGKFSKQVQELQVQMPDVAGKEAALSHTVATLERHEQDLPAAVQGAKDTAAAARELYNDAVQAISATEKQKAEVDALEQRTTAKHRQVEELAQQAAAAQQEIERLKVQLVSNAQQEKTLVEQLKLVPGELEKLEVALTEARAVQHSKAKELAAARAAVATADSMLLARRDAMAQHLKHVDAVEAKLLPLEKELTQVDAELNLMRVQAREKAELSDAARNRALAKKQSAEELAEEARRLKLAAQEQLGGVERAKHQHGEIAAAVEPLQAQAEEAAARVEKTRVAATEKVKDWEQTKQEVEVHKSKARELWQEAQHVGSSALETSDPISRIDALTASDATLTKQAAGAAHEVDTVAPLTPRRAVHSTATQLPTQQDRVDATAEAATDAPAAEPSMLDKVKGYIPGLAPAAPVTSHAT